jgi:hypothetical protein
VCNREPETVRFRRYEWTAGMPACDPEFVAGRCVALFGVGAVDHVEPEHATIEILCISRIALIVFILVSCY